MAVLKGSFYGIMPDGVVFTPRLHILALSCDNPEQFKIQVCDQVKQEYPTVAQIKFGPIGEPWGSEPVSPDEGGKYTLDELKDMEAMIRDTDQPAGRVPQPSGACRCPADPGESCQLTEQECKDRADVIQALSPDRRPSLTPAEIRRIGALTVQEDRSYAMDQALQDQRRNYQEFSKEQLIEEMVRRDKNLMLEGRQLSDGRMATNLLREILRHLLAVADTPELIKLGQGKQTAIDGVLKALGIPEADKRQLRLEGTTLGTGKSPEEVAAEFGALADGSLAHTADTTQARADVAESIRENPVRVGTTPEKQEDAKRKAHKRHLQLVRFTGFDSYTGMMWRDGEAVG